jgi:hypothetical protein
MGLLYLQLGYSALIGAAICILIMIPLQFLIGRKMSANSKELMVSFNSKLISYFSYDADADEALKLLFHPFCINLFNTRYRTLER